VERHKIILDVDLSNGMPVQDIDDGIALALALASPEFDLLGVTTCGGNCRTHESTYNSLLWLEMAGRTDIPVAEGREHPFVQDVNASFTYLETRREKYRHYWDSVPALPEPTTRKSDLKAHELIIETVKAHPGEVTIIKEGSLTNLALALLVAPEIASQVKAVVHMGGTFSQPRTVAPSEEGETPRFLWRYVLRMNTEFDPDATEIVVRSGITFTFVTGEVTSRVFLREEHLDQIEAAGTPYHQFIANTSRPWIKFHEAERHTPGAPMYDPLTLAVVMDPSYCTFVDMFCDFEKFHSRDYPYLYVDSNGPQASVAVDVDEARFEQFMVDRLAAPVLAPAG
jgi:inosine-uridine nucleoside N-ribohydrolase